MRADLVLRVIAKLLIPPILLFALYVQFHGDYGPGGGFQAGVIFAAAFITYGLVFGIDRGRRLLPDGVVSRILAAGLLLYAGVGLVGPFLGGFYLDYSVLATDPVAGQHLGILPNRVGRGPHRVRSHGSRFLRLCRSRALIMDLLGHYNYWIAIVLAMVGFYTVIARGNLVKKIIGLNIFQASVFLIYITTGKVAGGTAPIITENAVAYSNPLPHVLILTAIVVGVATTALGLALVIRIREAYGTIEEDEIQGLEEPT